MNNIENKNRTGCILLNTSKGLEVIYLNELIRVEALSNYCRLHFTNRHTLVVSKCLGWFEGMLSVYHFIRIHRGHIVNKEFIRSCSGNQLQLLNRESISISKRKKTDVIRNWMKTINIQNA